MFINLAKSIGQTVPEDSIRQEVMGRVEQGFIRLVDSYDEMITLRGHEIYKIFAVSNQPENLRRANEQLKTIQSLAVSSSGRSEEHTSELQSRGHLVCRLLL